MVGPQRRKDMKERTWLAFMGQPGSGSHPSTHSTAPSLVSPIAPRACEGGWEGGLSVCPGRTGSGFWCQSPNYVFAHVFFTH